MKIYGINYGGFGNAVFNLLGTILLKVLFPTMVILSFETMEEIEEFKKNAIQINDEYFLEILNNKIVHNIDILDSSQNYWNNCYCQYDEIFTIYRKPIVEYILAHPQEKIFAGHTYRFFPIADIISPKETEQYDILLHIRLGDFVHLGWVIHPENIRQLLEREISEKSNPKIGILVDHRKTYLEKKYVEYVRKVYPKAEILENNDILTDYNILRNAKHVIVSCSTFSWVAILFAREDQTVLFPNYEHRWNHEQFRRTHDRFTYYDFSRISETDLQHFLSDSSTISIPDETNISL